MKWNDVQQAVRCWGPGIWWGCPGRRPLTLRTASLLGVLVVAAILWYAVVRTERFADSLSSLPQDGRPAFVVTKGPHLVVPRNANLVQRLYCAYWNLRIKWERKDPGAIAVPPSPVQLCSVLGSLNQCTQLTGTRYLIAREAVERTVNFGTTNTLNGTQWTAALERALRGDGLLMLSNKAGVVKVIPKDNLEEYRKAGLVKANE